MKYCVDYFDTQGRFRTAEVEAIDEPHITVALKEAGHAVKKVYKSKVIGEGAVKGQKDLFLAS